MGSRKGAMVGMTPNFNVPLRGFFKRSVKLLKSSTSVSIDCALRNTSDPISVNRTFRLVRSKSVAPRVISSSLIPADRVDCVTNNFSEAWRKFNVSDNVIKYVSCLIVGNAAAISLIFVKIADSYVDEVCSSSAPWSD